MNSQNDKRTGYKQDIYSFCLTVLRIYAYLREFNQDKILLTGTRIQKNVRLDTEEDLNKDGFDFMIQSDHDLWSKSRFMEKIMIYDFSFKTIFIVLFDKWQ